MTSTDADLIPGDGTVLPSTEDTLLLGPFHQRTNGSGGDDFLLEFDADSSRFPRIRRLVIEACTTGACVSIVQILAIRITVAIVQLGIETFVEAADAARSTRRPFVPEWGPTATVVSSRGVDTLSITVTVVQIGRVALVDDETALRSGLGRVVVVIAGPATAVVAILLVEAVGKSGTRVQRGIRALIHPGYA